MTEIGEERRTPENGGGKMTVDQVERELARLRMNDDGTVGLRSSVLNLIVVTSEQDAPQITRSISELADRYPSRAIVLISDPDGEKNLDVRLAAFCSLRGGANQHICSEQITVHAEGPPARHLDSIAGPLLMPDLPTFLFYPGEFSAESPEFSRVASLSEHIIVDSNSSSDFEETFREVAKLTGEASCPPVGDLQWATLTPWRSLAGDLFGSADRAADLEGIRRVEIAHAPDGASRAMLFAGWTSYVFGWKPVSTEKLAGCKRFVFEKPDGSAVEFTVSPLGPEGSGDADAPLSRITLESHDSVFEVSRPKNREEVCVRVIRNGELVGESTARLGSFDTSAMLGQELKRRGRDRTYENSLKRAVEVLNL
ncbi:glucose-6-phosphate dehydrogenase assembly protein OpcA [Rubrobacter indicoceani]|uniref:glucose-6-phosphate dehydrogenase assembly protein OpcA n=1 Tax=Rubrobacter indicoceani TaxID=2051957 RepID=UPI0013C4BB30|nr:glucose-6-phosphate dehydrogenase assembly protein OpcA [Rubrobacter indicoceani]